MSGALQGAGEDAGKLRSDSRDCCSREGKGREGKGPKRDYDHRTGIGDFFLQLLFPAYVEAARNLKN
jgi:hypothetical protein